MSFGQRLRGLRRDFDLSQAELGDRAGCSVNTIRKLESDERRPSRELATRLSEVFEFSPRERAEFLRMARGGQSAGRPRLPSTMTRLIGREQDVAIVRERLVRSDVRLLTLVGPPGVGKTRLALQLATELQEVFRNGAAFVPLAALRDGALVVECIAQTLGVRGSASRSLVDALVEHVSSRQLLLVLDNFEQVFSAREYVAVLLTAAPQLRVLVTSREALAMYGEHVYVVPTLGLPEPAAPRRRRRILKRSPAETLFLERARAARPNYAADALDQPVVADICVRLEGLPLAIELAASRVKTTSPMALLEQLGQRLDVLSVGPADFSPRQRSMRGALDWSYELLDALERRVFACVSLFAGGATLEAIAVVCTDVAQSSAMVKQAVEALADKSLLQVSQVAGGTRFAMLETIREYALERVGEVHGVDEDQTRHRRHADYFATLAEQARDGLRGAEQILWRQRLEADHDNLRAALDWALEHGEAKLLGRLCAALWPFWRTRGYFHEGRRWLSEALALGPQLPQTLRARVLNGAGVLAVIQTDFTIASQLLTESRDVYIALGDPVGVAHATSNLGWLAHDCDETERARTLFERSLVLRRELGDQWGEAWSLNNLGVMALEQPDPSQARALFTESADLFRRVGDALGLAQALSNLGWAIQELGDYARATQLFSESLALAGGLDDAWVVSNNLVNLALMALYCGDYRRAAELFGDGLLAFRELGDRRGVAEALEGLAGVAGVEGRPQQSACIFGVAEALREAIGAPLLPAERVRYEAAVGVARMQLDDAAWRKAWDTGRAMSVDESVATLLEEAAWPAGAA